MSGVHELDLARPVTRDSILALERVLLQHPQAALPVFHHFAGGVYARELHIPKGTALTGKIHRFGHINVLLKGDITVLTEHGMQRLVAPCVLCSSPGIKRAGFAHEDTIWITFHATEETDPEKIEQQCIVPDYSQIEGPVAPDLIPGEAS